MVSTLHAWLDYLLRAYAAAVEKDKFFDDATWLSEDITANVTFNTVKPLLNFWAAFTASNEVF